MAGDGEAAALVETIQFIGPVVCGAEAASNLLVLLSPKSGQGVDIAWDLPTLWSARAARGRDLPRMFLRFLSVREWEQM